MTILQTCPWLAIAFLAAAGLHIAVSLLPGRKITGWICALFHAAMIAVYFLLGASLEDLLLFLLFSFTAALVCGMVLSPGKRDLPEKDREDAP